MNTQINLQEVAPAVFAMSPDSKVSDKYTFVNTSDVIKKLNSSGWVVVDAKQSGRKKKTQYGRHMIVLENSEYVKDNGVKARVYIHNSHDRTKRFQIGIGFFIQICSNGLMVKDITEYSDDYNVKHMNVTLENIDSIIEETVKKFQVHYERINQYHQITLTDDEKIELATKAIQLRYSKAKEEINPRDIIVARHEEQNSNNLWDVFNVLQENLMKGGTEYKSKKGRNMKTRAVKSLEREVYFNENLWMIMEGMRVLRMT